MIVNIESITIRNFKSYGDYDTTITINDLKSCLISGQNIIDDETNVEENSNGSGKSTIADAILWCLFGRTNKKSSPGDSVINWATKKDCYVEILFKNKDKLKRTRKVDGHNDLIYTKDGDDESLGTTKMQQNEILKQFNLVWEIFNSCVVFAQKGQTLMDMSDTKRIEALEKEFRLDRIKLYADTSKEKKQKVELMQKDYINTKSTCNKEIDNLKELKLQINNAKEKFEQDKSIKINQIDKNIENIKLQLSTIETPNIDQIKSKLDLIEKANILIKRLNDECAVINNAINTANGEITVLNKQLQKWSTMGDICGHCEQTIDSNHVCGEKDKISNQINVKKSEINELAIKKQKVNEKSSEISQKIKENEPKHSIKEANQILMRISSLQDTINKYENDKINTINSVFSMDSDTKAIDDKIIKLNDDIKEIDKKIATIDKLLLHYHYIYRLYNDRRKIKSYILSEYIPYFNDRIMYYLNLFKSKRKIQFADTLHIKSEDGDNNDYSGGENKKINLSVMFALFDLHTAMYGLQSNILIFDEVDTALDLDGSKRFIDIIKTEILPKVDTILIISHRPDMKGAFDSEIIIRNENNFSRVMSIIK